MLQALADQNVSNAMIALDHAMYHRFLPEEALRGPWKKHIMIDYCVDRSIAISFGALNSAIRD